MKSDTKLAEQRKSKWLVQVYPEWCTEFSNIDALETYIKTHFNYVEYALILHDKDFREDNGDLVKPHFHIYLRVKSPMTLQTVCNRFCITKEEDKRFASFVDSTQGTLQYLVHKNHKNKHLYDIKEVRSNIVDLEDIILFGDKEGETIYNLLKNFVEWCGSDFNKLNVHTFCDYAMYHGKIELVVKKIYFINTYLYSLTTIAKAQKQNKD